MSDPSLPMQAALIARLKDVPAVTNIVGQRILDHVNPTTEKPYLNLGQPQVLPDKAACVDGAEIFYTVHGWSSVVGSVQIKQLGAAVLAALDEFPLPVTGHHVVIFEMQQMTYLDDPDGITKHFAAVFRALTEPTA